MKDQVAGVDTELMDDYPVWLDGVCDNCGCRETVTIKENGQILEVCAHCGRTAA